MDEFEAQVRRSVRHFSYPPTPVMALRNLPPYKLRRSRSYALRALAGVAVLVIIVMVTPLRAAVREWLQIGAITIFIGEQPAVTPALPNLMDLFGETTFAQAQDSIDVPLRSPAGFGPPDYVYLQNVDGDVVIMVWLPRDSQPALSMFQFAPDSGAYIKPLSMIQNAEVNGEPALWTEQSYHRLEYANGVQRVAALVEGNVLIWQEEDTTFRLESGLSLEETVRIAESLR